MDRRYIETALEGLKATTSNKVQESLLKIRNKVTTNKEGIKLFAECDGLNALVPHLRKPNERILDLTLSILGNCLTSDECRIEVCKLHIVPSVLSVLKTVSRDSIVGRACRVIGNIAQKYSNAEDLHVQGAVPALTSVIVNRDKTTSCPTLTMAVRAIRQLWIVQERREEMLALNSVHSIALLLISVCETIGILPYVGPDPYETAPRKSQEELIETILKSFLVFTSPATNQCAEQIQGSGQGYTCLVKITRKYGSSSLALKCLTNLCHLSSCRPLLGDAGMIPCLAAILTNSSSDVCTWPDGTARALSQLSSESVNRARIRLNGGLTLLMRAAEEHTFALQALLQYVFDDISFEILVNDHIVSVLVQEIRKHLTTMDNEHDYKEHAHERKDKTLDSDSKEKRVDKVNNEKTGLLKRRKCLEDGDEDSLNVVIERDNMFIGFNETINESDESLGEIPERKHLKRTRSNSPTSFKKRSRNWGLEVYWEMKNDKASTSRNSLSPASPVSPGSDVASGFSPDRGRRFCDWSPESGFEGSAATASPNWTDYQWSPSSSGPTSPFSVEESSNSEVSGRYSPVCSEHEPEEGAAPEGEAPATDSVVEAAQAALDGLAVDDTETLDDEPFPFGLNAGESYLDKNSSRIACTLILLYRVVNGSCVSAGPGPVLPAVSIQDLTTEESLNALLDYTERSRRPMGRAARILTLIFDNPMCLTNILKHRIVLRLHRMSKTCIHSSKCQQCRLLMRFSLKLIAQLTVLAEASHGVGEISYQLQRGTDEMKRTLALTLSYIVKSKTLLRKYYIVHRSLDELLQSVNNEPLEHYVTALGKVSTIIRVKDPKLLETRFSDYITITYDPILDGLSKEEIVTFELDDMSTVKANRTFLCQNSDVFNAMLMGCFKESVEETVKIKDVTKDGLEYLLSLLHFGINNPQSDIKIFPMAERLETNLEVLILADRFLLEKLKILLNSAILQFKMLPDTADKIYIWSLCEGMGFLCVESVAYILTGKMLDTERAQAFKSIMASQFQPQFYDDVVTMIRREINRIA